MAGGPCEIVAQRARRRHGPRRLSAKPRPLSATAPNSARSRSAGTVVVDDLGRGGRAVDLDGRDPLDHQLVSRPAVGAVLARAGPERLPVGYR